MTVFVVLLAESLVLLKRADGRTVRPTLVVLDRRYTRVERVGFAWERGRVGATRE